MGIAIKKRNNMTVQEALDEIRSTPKWYFIGGIEDSRLINTARRIEVGIAQEETKRKFFARFGYDFQVYEKVVKK